ERDIQTSPGVYDAMYYLAYGTVMGLSTGAGSGGVAAAAGLPLVSDAAGAPVAVGPGPTGLAVAERFLPNGTAVDLFGTSGPARFDREQQARPGSLRVYCWDAAGRTVDADLDQYARGLLFNLRTRQCC